MNQSTEARWSLPTLNWLDFPAAGEPVPVAPLEAVLDGIAAAGWTATGIDHLTVLRFLAEHGTVAELADALRSRRLRCTDVGVLRLGVDSAPERAAELVGLAHALDAPVCVTAAVGPLSAAALADARRCADVLAEAGVRLALEFAGYTHLPTLQHAISVCEAIGWERCGVLVDAWHFFQTGTPWDALAHLHAESVALVHVSDAGWEATGDLAYESRFLRRLPGRGRLPLDAFYAALEELGYEGTLSVEVLSGELRSLPPHEAARQLMAAVDAPSPRSAQRVQVSTFTAGNAVESGS